MSSMVIPTVVCPNINLRRNPRRKAATNNEEASRNIMATTTPKLGCLQPSKSLDQTFNVPEPDKWNPKLPVVLRPERRPYKSVFAVNLLNSDPVTIYDIALKTGKKEINEHIKQANEFV